jgi:hypothetical protein
LQPEQIEYNVGTRFDNKQRGQCFIPQVRLCVICPQFNLLDYIEARQVVVMNGELPKRRIVLDWERYVTTVERSNGVNLENRSVSESNERVLWWSNGNEWSSLGISSGRDPGQETQGRVDQLRDDWEGNLWH